MPISDLSFSLNDPAAGPPTRSPYFRGKPKRRRLQDDLPLPHLPSLSSSAFNPAGPPPLPPSKNLNIRSAAANATAAEALKQILEEGGEVPVPETIGAPRDNTLGGHHFENLFADQFGVSRRRLRDLSHMSCSGDEGEERAKRRGDAHILIGERATPPPAPSPALPPQPVAPQAEEVLYSTSFEEVPESNANVDANSNSKAEVHYARHTTLFVSDAGCDIPMPRAGDPLPPVRLEADLPPMAVEHPTRVWNTLLHALATELQPLIRWEYDALDLDRNGSMGWIAHLSLILPPTHSDIAGHPLAHVLPKNRYSAEYVTAVEALGGAKTWTGHYRKLKTDAQNSALLRCISQNALSWVHAPLLADVPKDEEEDEVDHKDTASTIIILRPGDPPTPLVAVCPSMVVLTHELAKLKGCSTPVSVIIDFDTDHETGLYGCRLDVGANPEVMYYQERANHLTPDAAVEAAARKALELDVAGFMEWLRVGPASDEASQVVETIPVLPVASSVIKTEMDVDWVQQLNNFCSDSGLPPPRYHQRTERGSSTVFYGIVKVEDDVFESNTPHESLKKARQQISREVFVNHFGQGPVHLL